MNDTITKEQVLNAYNNAPAIVRAVFNADLTTQIIVGMRAKFQLHIDSAGILGKEVGYLLLGLTDPNKFIDHLKSQNFSEQTVNEIVKEVNQKIFVPLREEMRKGSSAAAQPPRPARPTLQPVVRPVGGNPISTNVPLPVRPTAQGQVRQPANEPFVPRPSARPDLRSVLNAVTAKPAQSPVPSASADALVGSPTEIVGAASRLLEDHEEPHIEFKKITPPANLPGVVQPLVPTVPKPIPPPTPKPIIKEYSSDPYREPIDEK